MPVHCDKCNLNYCLKHRHPQDHSCENATGKSISKAGLAAMSRVGEPKTTSSTTPSGSNGPRNFFSSLTSSSRASNNPVRNVSSLQGNLVNTYLVLRSQIKFWGGMGIVIPKNAKNHTPKYRVYKNVPKNAGLLIK